MVYMWLFSCKKKHLCHIKKPSLNFDLSESVITALEVFFTTLEDLNRLYTCSSCVIYSFFFKKLKAGMIILPPCT